MAASRVSAAPVTNAMRTLPSGSRRTRRRRLNTGSSTGPVVREGVPRGPGAAELAGVRPRPRNLTRSVSYSTAPPAGPSAAETWIAQTGFSSADRGRRRASRASGPGTNSVSRNSFAKAGVALIRAAVIQADFGVAGQLKLAGPAIVIDERDQTHFRVVVPRDADGPRRLNVAVPAAELGPVGVEGDLVFIPSSGHRLKPDRPDPAVLGTADVDELAPAVAGRVLPPAGDIQVHARCWLQTRRR